MNQRVSVSWAVSPFFPADIPLDTLLTVDLMRTDFLVIDKKIKTLATGVRLDGTLSVTVPSVSEDDTYYLELTVRFSSNPFLLRFNSDLFVW